MLIVHRASTGILFASLQKGRVKFYGICKAISIKILVACRTRVYTRCKFSANAMIAYVIDFDIFKRMKLSGRPIRLVSTRRDVRRRSDDLIVFLTSFLSLYEQHR